MAGRLLLEIVTPERMVLRQEVTAVVATGVEGEFCVLPQHIPFLTVLRVGSLCYHLDGRRHYAYVGGGFAEVSATRVRILAEVAELPEEIDVDRAMKARERALARLEAQRLENVDYVRARSALQRALFRLKIHEDARL